MRNYSELKKSYDGLIALLSTITKSAGVSASVEEITDTFNSEFIFYAGALSLCDGEIADEELKALSEIFDYKFDHLAVMNAAQAFSKTLECIPACVKIAVDIDNTAADNKEINVLLSVGVVSMFANIAQAIVAADQQLTENEAKLAIGYVNFLSDYVDKNLSDAAKAKLPKKE